MGKHYWNSARVSRGDAVVSLLLEEGKIDDTIKRIPKKVFAIMDFIIAFREAYPNDWRHLTERSGQFGEKRRHTVTTYLSNRLGLSKPNSLLVPFRRFREDEFRDYRKTT